MQLTLSTLGGLRWICGTPGRARLPTENQHLPPPSKLGPTQDRRNPPHLHLRHTYNQNARTDNQDGDGFVKVVSKKRTQRATQNRCGTALSGYNSVLCAATPMTPVYISRFHYTTEAEDITQYINKKTKFSLRVQHLVSHHNASFKAFVVLVPTKLLPSVLSEDFWPKNVVFRGRIPTPDKGHIAVSK